MMKFPILMESHNPIHGSSHHQLDLEVMNDFPASHVDLSENVVYPYTQWLMIIIPIYPY